MRGFYLRIAYAIGGDRWLSASGLLSASLLLGGGLNYLYHVALGRLLGPESYGAFGALLGLFYLLWLFNQSVQLRLARLSARGIWPPPAHTLRSIASVGLGILLSLSILSLPLARLLRLDEPLWVLFLALVWLISLPLPAAKGLLQGRQLMSRLAGLNVLEPAIKLLAGAGFVSLGLGLWGAWGGWAIAALLAFFAAIVFLRAEGHLELPRPAKSLSRGEARDWGGLALLAAFALAVPTNVDVLWVKHALSAHEAGLYTAAAVLGKGFLFIALGVGAVLLAKAAGVPSLRDARAHLMRALAIAGSINGLAALVCLLAPELIVRLLFGEAYTATSALVRLYGPAMLAFSGVVLLLNYGLARQLKPLILGLAAISALEAVLLGLVASSPLNAVGLLLISHMAMLGAGALALLCGASAAQRSQEIAIVAPFPPPGVRHGAAGGVASYTRNLVEALGNRGLRPTVLASRIPESPQVGAEGPILRCWEPGPGYVPSIWQAVRRRRPAIVHIQHEIFLFGSGFSPLLFPLLLLALRPLTKVIVTLHGVLPLSKLDRPFLKENGLKGQPLLLRLGLLLLMQAIIASAHIVIVHEEKLKGYLADEYRCNAGKIVVIPHGIESARGKISSEEAKGKLGLSGRRVIMFLGYLTGYKGVELLIEGFSKAAEAHPDWVLVIAGGPHPRRRAEPGYQAYLEHLKGRIARLGPQGRWLGFVPEEDLPLCLSAADLMVFPYREVIASSGPLALAISYDRPFLASEAFRGVLDEGLLFKLDPKALGAKLEEFFASAKLKELARRQAAAWREERSWERVAQKMLGLYSGGIGWQSKATQGGLLYRRQAG